MYARRRQLLLLLFFFFLLFSYISHLVFLDRGHQQVVDPISDRMVVFQSRGIEHEVLNSEFDRCAVSSWFCEAHKE